MSSHVIVLLTLSGCFSDYFWRRQGDGGISVTCLWHQQCGGLLEQGSGVACCPDVRKGGRTFELDLEPLVGFLLRKGREEGRSRQRDLQLEKSQLSFHGAANSLLEEVQQESQRQPFPAPPLPQGQQCPVGGATGGPISLSPEMLGCCSGDICCVK